MYWNGYNLIINNKIVQLHIWKVVEFHTQSSNLIPFIYMKHYYSQGKIQTSSTQLRSWHAQLIVRKLSIHGIYKYGRYYQENRAKEHIYQIFFWFSQVDTTIENVTFSKKKSNYQHFSGSGFLKCLHHIYIGFTRWEMMSFVWPI